MRQLAPLFCVSPAAAHRIIDRHSPLLALVRTCRHPKAGEVVIVDGTLVPTHDRSVAAPSKNCRHPANLQSSSTHTPAWSWTLASLCPETATTAGIRRVRHRRRLWRRHPARERRLPAAQERSSRTVGDLRLGDPRGLVHRPGPGSWSPWRSRGRRPHPPANVTVPGLVLEGLPCRGVRHHEAGSADSSGEESANGWKLYATPGRVTRSPCKVMR